jgi:hypothetical protein
MARPIPPFGQNIDQVKLMWTPHRGQYCFFLFELLIVWRSIVWDFHASGA